MTRRSDGEAVRVRPGDRFNHEVAVHVYAQCGCLYVRSRLPDDDRGRYRTLVTLSLRCLRGPISDSWVRTHGQDIDWTRVAAAYCMALSESKPA